MVSVGDKIKDNDPRMGTRVLTIVRMNDTYVFAANYTGSREYRIKITRIYTDGKPRRSGFSKI